MLDWREIAAIVGIMSALNGGFLWACKAMLENQRKSFLATLKEITRKNQQQDEQVQQLRNDLSEFRVHVTEHYLRREDSIVWFGRFEQKIDAIWQYLLKLSNETGST